MKITTKYSNGDTVYPISKRIERNRVMCPLCNGSGRVQISNTNRRVNCPDCYSHGFTTEDSAYQWSVETPGLIGKIQVEIVDPQYGDDSREVYMLDRTGIGSGTLWYCYDIFPTREEAQAECDKRNSPDYVKTISFEIEE